MTEVLNVFENPQILRKKTKTIVSIWKKINLSRMLRQSYFLKKKYGPVNKEYLLME